MPKMQFKSNAKPSLYAYPEPLKPPKKEEKEKVCPSFVQSFFSLLGENSYQVLGEEGSYCTLLLTRLTAEIYILCNSY